MEVIRMYFDKNNKNCLIIEGINEKGKPHVTHLVVPPTNKDRLDIINYGKEMPNGYRYDRGDDVVIVVAGKKEHKIIWAPPGIKIG